MAPKKSVDLELADKFYAGVQEYVTKLEKTRAAIEKNKASISEQYEGYDVEALSALENSGVKIEDKDAVMSDFKQYSNAASAVAALEELEKKHVQNKEILEKNIKIAIAKYVTQTEKEIEKVQKNRDSYEKYIKEEQEKLAALEEEIKSLEGIEEQAEVLKDKKEDYETLKAKLEERLKKLEAYDKDIEAIKAELEMNKEKYKDYLELADKDITEPEEVVIPETAVSEEEVEAKKKTDEEEKTKKGEDEEIKGKESSEKTHRFVASESEVKEDKDIVETEEEKAQETDEQAFNRIYKLLSKKKTRDSVSESDIDKMIEILSNKENYSKLNIETKRFLDLGIFPSKAEKIYKQLGKRLSYDAYKVTKNSEVLSKANRAELAKWENINELGVNIDEKTETEIALDQTLETAEDKDKEQILAVKTRMDKYRQSMVVLDEVMFERGELQFVNKELPAAKEDVAERAKLEGRLLAALESAVKDEVTVPTSKESHEAPSKTEKAVDSHDTI